MLLFLRPRKQVLLISLKLLRNTTTRPRPRPPLWRLDNRLSASLHISVIISVTEHKALSEDGAPAQGGSSEISVMSHSRQSRPLCDEGLVVGREHCGVEEGINGDLMQRIIPVPRRLGSLFPPPPSSPSLASSGSGALRRNSLIPSNLCWRQPVNVPSRVSWWVWRLKTTTRPPAVQFEEHDLIPRL